MELNINERLDEVNDGIKLIQDKRSLPFGTDALLLAAFMRPCSGHAVELGSGSGIISLLAAGRSKFQSIDAVELREELFALCVRNISLNGFENSINPICADIRSLPVNMNGKYKAVFSNPPYIAAGGGKENREPSKNASRHETSGDIFDFCTAAAKLLEFRGSFYVVWRTDRLVDLLSAMRKAGLEPKRMTFVYPDAGHSPCLILSEAKKGGGTNLFVTRPLMISENDSQSADYAYIMENGLLPPDFYN